MLRCDIENGCAVLLALLPFLGVSSLYTPAALARPFFLVFFLVAVLSIGFADELGGERGHGGDEPIGDVFHIGEIGVGLDGFFVEIKGAIDFDLERVDALLGAAVTFGAIAAGIRAVAGDGQAHGFEAVFSSFGDCGCARGRVAVAQHDVDIGIGATLGCARWH